MSHVEIFLSFAHEDEAVARSLAEDLGRAGHDVFYATEALRAGDGLTSILDALARCEVFVVLLTPATRGATWVTKELGLAVARQAAGEPLRIVPIMLGVDRPHPWLADLLGVFAGPDTDLAAGVLEVLATDPGGNSLSLQTFVDRLPHVPTELHVTATAMAALVMKRDDESEEAEDVRDRVARARAMMKSRGLSAEATESVIAAARRGLPAPVIRDDLAGELRRFARRAEPLHFDLALKLEAIARRHHSGITLSAFVEAVEDQLRDSMPDRDVRWWRAEQLFDEAHTLGLLCRSSENVSNPYHVARAQQDPSADWGPLLHPIAQLVQLYRAASVDGEYFPGTTS